MEQEDMKEKKSATRFIYVRDNKGFPIGCIAYKVSTRSASRSMLLAPTVNTRIEYGYSLWNPKDKFNKKVAKQCAEGRMLKRGIFHSESGSIHPNDMLRLACETISKQKYMTWPRNEDDSLCELSAKFRKGAARLAQKLEAAGLPHQKVA